jgi:hypothetical protein
VTALGKLSDVNKNASARDTILGALKTARENPKTIASLVEYRQASQTIIERAYKLHDELLKLDMKFASSTDMRQCRHRFSSANESLHTAYHSTLRDACSFLDENEWQKDMKRRQGTLQKCRTVLHTMQTQPETAHPGESIYGPEETLNAADEAASKHAARRTAKEGDVWQQKAARMTGSYCDGTPYVKPNVLVRTARGVSSMVERFKADYKSGSI